MQLIFLQNTVFRGKIFAAGEGCELDDALAKRFIKAKLAYSAIEETAPEKQEGEPEQKQETAPEKQEGEPEQKQETAPEAVKAKGKGKATTKGKAAKNK